ncbi:MAG: ComEA family DNA-binding protein [Candidatus Rifleibacteriota bacterium]
MPELTEKEMRQARVLAALPLVFGLIWSLLAPGLVHLSNAVPAGKASISVQSLDQPGQPMVVENHQFKPDHIFINNATFEQLLVCPGIGTATARNILLERSYGQFADWRDLNDRVKGISDKKIEKLQEAGVRLNPEAP